MLHLCYLSGSCWQNIFNKLMTLLHTITYEVCPGQQSRVEKKACSLVATISVFNKIVSQILAAIHHSFIHYCLRYLKANISWLLGQMLLKVAVRLPRHQHPGEVSNNDTMD